MEYSTIKPTRKNILLQQVEITRKTDSGIILSDKSSANDTPPAKIVEVGAFAMTSFAKGQIVFPNWSKAFKVQYDGATYYIIDEEHILAYSNT